MSTLLKRPETYLALLAAGALLAFADSHRPPDRQQTARSYIAAVRAAFHTLPVPTNLF